MYEKLTIKEIRYYVELAKICIEKGKEGLFRVGEYHDKFEEEILKFIQKKHSGKITFQVGFLEGLGQLEEIRTLVPEKERSFVWANLLKKILMNSHCMPFSQETIKPIFQQFIDDINKLLKKNVNSKKNHLKENLNGKSSDCKASDSLKCYERIGVEDLELVYIQLMRKLCENGFADYVYVTHECIHLIKKCLMGEAKKDNLETMLYSGAVLLGPILLNWFQLKDKLKNLPVLDDNRAYNAHQEKSLYEFAKYFAYALIHSSLFNAPFDRRRYTEVATVKYSSDSEGNMPRRMGERFQKTRNFKSEPSGSQPPKQITLSQYKLHLKESKNKLYDTDPGDSSAPLSARGEKSLPVGIKPPRDRSLSFSALGKNGGKLK